MINVIIRINTKLSVASTCGEINPPIQAANVVPIALNIANIPKYSNIIKTAIVSDENVSLKEGGTLSGNLIFTKFFSFNTRYISTVTIPTKRPIMIPFPSRYVRSAKDIP